MIRQRTAGLIFLFVLGSALLSAQAPPASDRPTPLTRRILILNELDPSSVSTSFIDDGIRDALRGSKYHIDVYPEYMKTGLFPDEADQKLIRDFYIYLYRDHRPDVIITVGNAPLQFMVKEHRQNFAGIPVVYCFPNGAESGLEPDLEFTGVTIGIDAAATLKAALQMLPNTRHVFVITGTGVYDLTLIKEVKRQLNDYSSRVDIAYLAGLAMPDLRKRLNSLPEDSIVLFASLVRDGAGTYYNSQESGPLISSAANAPVFSLLDVQIGYGQVGGDLVNTREQGAIAGREALKILDGVRPGDIPVALAPNGFVFDWRALQRWGLSESDLPPGSNVLNRPPTPWELYKWYILGGLSLMGLEALLIFGLLLNRARARRAEAELSQNQRRLAGLIETALDAIIAVDEEQRIVLFNAAAEHIFGCSAASAIGSSLDRFVPQRFREAHSVHIRRFGDTGTTSRVMGALDTLFGLRSTGEEFPIEASISQVETSGKKLYTVIIRDITNRKQAEAELRRLNRALRTIVECRRRMAQAQDELAMLTDVCRVLVDLGGYRMAWVGFAENDEAKSIRPVVNVGHNEGYVEALKLTWADEKRGHGPTGTAIRTARPSVGWDFANDPCIAPWRDEALRRGFFSSISLPLLQDGRAFGALTLYSSLREAFDDNEIRLLTDLTNDVAYGIQALRTRAEREQSAQELEKSEARFRAIFEKSGMGIVLLDLTGRPLQTNPAFQHMIGYSENELRGMTFTDFTHPDHREHDRQIVCDLLEDKFESKYELEKRYIRKDGQIVWARLTLSVVKDIQGRPQYTVAMIQDITERKRAEEALRESEAQLREAEHIAGIGSSVWDVNTDTTTWSPELYQIMGVDSNQPPPKHAGRSRIYTHESWARLSAAVEEALAARKPYDLEVEFVRGDGTVRWGHARGTPVCDIAGRVVRLSGTLQDITDRKRAQEALLRLRQAVDASGEVVFMTDRKGVITFVNQEFTRLYEYREEEVIGKATPHILKDNEVSEAEYDGFWQAALTMGSAQGEIVNRTKNGRKVNVERSASAVRDEHGDIVGFISIQRDITQKKHLEQQLMQAQKMEAVGQLAGGVAHDFNNILSIILGYADLTLDDPTLAQRPKKRLAEIKNAANRAVGIIRQLLTFSRKQVVETKMLNLNAVVQGTTKMLGRLLGEDIEVSVMLDPYIGDVSADPAGIDQIILNLAVNARDAMPNGGKLTIQTANATIDADSSTRHGTLTAGDYVVLTVSDTGVGMDAETQKHIFEPFFTTKEKGRGTGLGLSTVFGIVEQSGGSIWTYSDLGCGTTFKIYLPRAAAAGPNVTEVTTEMIRGDGETILLAEDDSGLRKLNVELLRDLGYNVIEAVDGAEALRIIERHPDQLHLLLTDVIMPGMNGQQLAEEALRQRPNLKVLFVSGHTSGAVREKIMASGAPFLQKPLSRNLLAKTLREILDSRDTGGSKVAAARKDV